MCSSDLMEVFHESWTLEEIAEPDVKSGYGFTLQPTLQYSNELMSAVSGKIDLTRSPDVELSVDHRLIDPSLEYYDEDATYTGDDKVTLDMLRDESPEGATFKSSYDLPQMYLEQETGLMYTKNQKENGGMAGTPLQADKKLYVPVWIDEVGAYETKIRNKEPLGSHFMNFDVTRNVNVDAYMFHHTDSDTSDEDEILIHPMVQDDIPREW